MNNHVSRVWYTMMVVSGLASIVELGIFTLGTANRGEATPVLLCLMLLGFTWHFYGLLNPEE